MKNLFNGISILKNNFVKDGENYVKWYAFDALDVIKSDGRTIIIAQTPLSGDYTETVKIHDAAFVSGGMPYGIMYSSKLSFDENMQLLAAYEIFGDASVHDHLHLFEQFEKYRKDDYRDIHKQIVELSESAPFKRTCAEYYTKLIKTLKRECHIDLTKGWDYH